MSEQKKQLETAINKTGKAFDLLVKEVEKIGDGLTPELIDTGFKHLMHLVELARQRAHFAQQTQGFSFDTAPPTYPMHVPTIMPVVQQPMQLAPGERPKRPSPREDGLFNGVERLVGTGKPNHVDPPAKVAVAPQRPADPDTEALLSDDE